MCAYLAQAGLSTPRAAANVTALMAAVEARYDARLREAASFPDVDDHARKAGHFLADVVAGWPNGSRIRFGLTEGLAAPADLCQFHPPTGSPCDCGHDGGADCHPKEGG
jgi:hypothetical protein